MAETTNTQLTSFTKKEVATAITNETIADSLLASFNKLASQGQLTFPEGYAFGNQVKLMYTSISQNANLTSCTPISIGESMAEALIQGLEVDKDQIYFIARGKKCTMFRSYYGDVKVAKETGLVKEIFARPIYEGDEYELDTDNDGLPYIKNHKTSLTNMDKELIGGYAWAVMKDGSKRYCIMTKKEIDASWSKSTDPSRNVQKTFPQEMAKRTTIRRLVKMIFNTSSTNLGERAKSVIASYNRSTKEEYDNDEKPTKSTVKNILTDENGEPIVADAKAVEETKE